VHRFCFCNCIASGVLGLYNRVLGFGRFRDVRFLVLLDSSQPELCAYRGFFVIIRDWNPHSYMASICRTYKMIRIYVYMYLCIYLSIKLPITSNTCGSLGRRLDCWKMAMADEKTELSHLGELEV